MHPSPLLLQAVTAHGFQLSMIRCYLSVTLTCAKVCISTSLWHLLYPFF